MGYKGVPILAVYRTFDLAKGMVCDARCDKDAARKNTGERIITLGIRFVIVHTRHNVYNTLTIHFCTS